MPQDIDRFDDDTDSAVRTFPKGTVIFREGQVSDVAYVVKKGRISIYRVLGNKRVRLASAARARCLAKWAWLRPNLAAARPRPWNTPRPWSATNACSRPCCSKARARYNCLPAIWPSASRPWPGRSPTALGRPLLAVCRILHLSWQAVARGEKPELDYAEVSRTIKDIVLLSQVEIDAVFERLKNSTSWP